MEQSYLARAAKYVTAQHKRQNWQKVVSGLCAVVVFCTVYALILPAITLTAPLACGLEEHQHGESCYEASGPVTLLHQQMCSEESIYADVVEKGEQYAPFVLHVHDDLCYQDGALICTLPEVPPHVHNEECWIDVLDGLICGLEETPEGEAPAGHVHTADCYVEVLACGQEEGAPIGGHIHDESCYTTETVPGALICENTEEDHQHDESCYSAASETSYLTCGQEESAPAGGHTHTPGCYETQLVCGLEEGEAASAHVHTEECYSSKERVEICFDPKIAHEHIPLCYNEYGEAVNADTACYDAYGVLTCTKWVTREHVHTEACFQEVEDPAAEPVKVLTCEITEHTHEDSCYTQEETGEPEEPVRQDDQWDAIFWSDVVSGSSDVVLDAWTNGSWMDTAAMDPEVLAQMHAAAETDLTRALQSSAIQVGSQAYDSALHGPMDPGRDFSIMLTWSLNSNSFSGMTYSYQFPWQISVENVEKRVLNDADGNQALTYSVWNNTLTVTYYAPAESVTTGFSLRASWSGDMGAETVIQWSRSDSTYVVFAEPELTVEKTMGEDGLRVAEDGTVWADYTVTVTNSGMVAASEITLTDVLEAEHFTFAQGAYENDMDYIVTVGGRDSYETFPAYEGGDTVTFPAFDLESGESRAFQYMAVMSAEDRAAVDAAVKASADPTQAGETVRNTATAVCHAFSGDLEFTSTSRATYGGPDSKHVENFTQVYETGAFNVSFTVNGDAQLPLGMTTEKLERTTGEGLQLTVDTLDETTEEYQAFNQHTEEDENRLDLQVLRIGLNYNGVKLDLADCDIQAVITPTEELRNWQPPRVLTYNLTDEEKAEVEAEQEKGFDLELEVMNFVPSEAEMQMPQVQTLGTLTVETADDDAVDTLQTAPASMTVTLYSDTMAISQSMNPYPEYTVEFYAYLDLLDWKKASNANAVPIIDTSGGKLPTNNQTSKFDMPGNIVGLKYLELKNNTTGATTTFVTKKTLTRIFAERTRQYNPKVSLNLTMLDNLTYEITTQNGVMKVDKVEDPHYDLYQVWVLKDGKDPAKEASWDKYDKAKLDDGTVKFTNNPQTKADNPNGYILITDKTVIRMVYNQNTGTHTNAVNFYDYDIGTDAYNKLGKLNAYNGGDGTKINKLAAASGKVKFAFGNNNVGTPFGALTWNGNLLNKFNTNTFHGNTFGLVQTSLDANGRIQFQNDLIVPKLFNEGSAAGKTSYADYTLGFKRSGDTYTLSQVNGAKRYNASDKLVAVSNLEKLVVIAPEQWTLKVPVPTNSFWPMDNAASAGAFPGKTGNTHDILFGKADEEFTYKMLENGKAVDATTTLDSDDKARHNSYFGMQFEFEFNLPEEYVGPLDYVFFGDDDLWLFLDGKLVCDLGGVKSSTCGEYVDLADYIERVDPNDKTSAYVGGKHKLQLFYLERGATGSTCWMQFTIPNIRSIPIDRPPEDTIGDLVIRKEVSSASEVDKNQMYGFQLVFQSATDLFSVKKFDKDLNAVEVQPTALGVYDFGLKDGEYLAVYDIPIGTKYTITEIGDALNSYETVISTDDKTSPEVIEGKVTSGTITSETIHVTYTNTFFYALPDTGGAGTSGTAWYTMGALPVMTAAVLVYKKKSRKKGGTYF